MKIRRLIGYCLYKTIGNMLPPANFRIRWLGRTGKYFRQLCGKLMLTCCGNNVNIYKNAVFTTEIELGNNSDIGYKSRIVGKCIIGNDVMMGPEVQIWTLNHDFTRTDIPMRLQGALPMKPVTIGNDVWIGSRVTILPGVTIGDGSIIGACAVISKDIPPYSVVVGNPAKIIRNRLKES